ncbi:MAG: FG-GAP-like repeat-containing protein [Bacteroidales bacterium]|nr:FG-GAP-like repeat-containing protein [Bacteroidales bacterium]
MKRIFILQLLFFGLISKELSAQPFRFEKRFDIPVNDSLGNSIKQPWVGGLNACIMGEIDLNFDGKPDLVVYDQHAEKILTFLNFGIGKNGLNDYRYAPQYEAYFPKITPRLNKVMWFQLIDFNGDGLPDLFVADGLGRVAVYKNVSQNPNIKFELYIPRLQQELSNGLYMDLYFSSLTFPHFVDIDGDGDLDLLVFGGMNGTTLHYYKNRSMERYGHADSLDFILEDEEWGCFRESDVSNQIILNTCDEENGYDVASTPLSHRSLSGVETTLHLMPKHGEGSTIFAIDFNGDSLYDLLLADGGFPTITALYNGGTHEKARITHVDTIFPRQSTSVKLLNCPAISAIDVDNCGEKELIFSPFSAVDFSTESYASNWIYKNMSTTKTTDFQLISQRFLQDEMLDFGMGAYPTVVDIDGNGLLDIVVGNYGIIDSAWEEFGVWKSRFVSDLILLKNIGTPTEPMFQTYPLNLTPRLDFAGAVPTFGDIDNCGKPELLIGTENGEIRLYKMQQTKGEGTLSGVEGFHFVLENPNILQENIGNFLAPQLFDLNGDGLLDLVAGSRITTWREGSNHYFKNSIIYLQNVGTPENPEFMLITDSLGRVDVSAPNRLINEGYSKPCFFRDAVGNTHLFCGNEAGNVFHYTDIDDNLQGTFRRLDNVKYLLNDRVSEVSEGTFTAIAVGDFNNDGLLDMVVGNHRGGLAFFYGISDWPVKNVDPVEMHGRASLRIYPNPVQDFLFIQSEENYQMRCEISDIQGRVVRPLQTIKNGEGIDVTMLTSGAYVLKIVVKNQVYALKFVKN